MTTGHVIEQRTYECSYPVPWTLHTILSSLSDGSYEVEVNLEHGGEHYHKGGVYDDQDYIDEVARDMEAEMLRAHGLGFGRMMR